jgi:hypothetical protein
MRFLLCSSFALGAQFVTCNLSASPVDTLRECAARVAPGTVGLEALRQQCPDLQAALQELGYAEALGDVWQSRLTSSGLRDLAGLAERYQPRLPGTGPDIAPVRGIVDGLVRERAPRTHSWWDAIKSWLRALLDRDGGRSLSWLDRLLDKIATAAGVMTVVVYGLLLCVVVLAVAFVIIELRAAGVFVRKRSPAQRYGDDPGSGTPRPEAMLDTAPLTEKPAILLRLLVSGLLRKGRLRADRHLTHRELVRRAVLDDSTQRERFARVAGLAEGLLYGPRPGSMDGVEGIVNDGRELLVQIEHASAAD